MMALVILIAAAVLVWAWKQPDARAIRFGDVAAVVAGLCALKLLSHSVGPLGLVAAAGAGGWAWFRLRKTPVTLSHDEAIALLEVPRDADAETIRAAHRRLIARVHPDAGGSDALARRVNAARDRLLGGLNRERG